MSELTDTYSPSGEAIRLGYEAATGVEKLGPLADLVGTWFGSHGWELIAVPSGPKDFRPIMRPYIEVMTFEPIGAHVPNRGGPVKDLFIYGLLYQTRITDRETNEPLHLENGMWLYLGESEETPIVRQASIPHGDVFLALGTAGTAAGGPKIPEINGLPPDPGPKTDFGYTDPYSHPSPPPPFQAHNPNEPLKEDIAGQQIVKTTTLSVSTKGGGGIVNIPFVEQQAKTTQFACTYWLETLGGPQGEEVQQLQYSQQSNLEFLPRFGEPDKLIMWPHVNVNTLRKQ